jgi:hypothetical protein
MKPGDRLLDLLPRSLIHPAYAVLTLMLAGWTNSTGYVHTSATGTQNTTLDGAELTRDDFQRVLLKELEDAAQYFEDDAPNEYVGCLFTDLNELSVKAIIDDISSGSVVAHSIRDFSSLVVFPDGAPTAESIL